MKQLSIKSNGKEWLLVSVPQEAYGFKIEESGNVIHQEYPSLVWNIDKANTRWIPCANGNVLGTFTPSTGEIDFEVKEEWVEKKSAWPIKSYKDYSGIGDFCFHFTDSFLSLLKAETEKAWPYETNPHGDYIEFATYERTPNMRMVSPGRHNQWHDAESKLMPSKLLVIEIK